MDNGEPAGWLRGFLFPAGEERARKVRAVRLAERGEMRMAPGAKWVAFAADEVVEATGSNFRWVARMGGSRFGFTTVTDMYEGGRGLLSVKLGGVIPVTKIAGADADEGELQRYLASVALCPAMLPSLEVAPAGANLVRMRDRNDPIGATVDWEIGEDGQPIACCAERPRMVGKQVVVTPWIAMAAEFREWEGMRVASRLSVAWRLAENEFLYYRSEVTSFAAVE